MNPLAQMTNDPCQWMESKWTEAYLLNLLTPSDLDPDIDPSPYHHTKQRVTQPGFVKIDRLGNRVRESHRRPTMPAIMKITQVDQAIRRRPAMEHNCLGYCLFEINMFA